MVATTIQQAAARARGELADAWRAGAGPGDARLLDLAARGTVELGGPRIGVPDVPRTEVDETGSVENWQPTERPAPAKPKPTDADFDNERIW